MTVGFFLGLMRRRKVAAIAGAAGASWELQVAFARNGGVARS